ncbi:hypothetical protein ABZV29_42330 [Streptomyces sp. NPDC005236]|uniref:hypothetical protein n=1 Tax=Streptomyces sp. NPDC005236 TaxID=3157028 RepID=UPI0033ABED26
MSHIAVSRGAAAFAVVVAAMVTTSAFAVLPDARTVAVVRVADDPSDTPSADESPCPGGEPKPCPASSQDREEVNDQRDKVEKDEEQAKQDMAAAKGQATKCPPASKECMSDLAGDGAEQKEGMAEARKDLENVHPVPSDNASAVLSGACGTFAAELPPALASSGDPAELTRVCELMNP